MRLKTMKTKLKLKNMNLFRGYKITLRINISPFIVPHLVGCILISMHQSFIVKKACFYKYLTFCNLLFQKIPVVTFISQKLKLNNCFTNDLARWLVLKKGK